MRTLIVLASIAALATACSDQDRPTSPASPRGATASTAPSTEGIKVPDASAAPTRYLKQVAYADTNVILKAGYDQDVDVACPPGMNVISGGFWQIGSGAVKYTKVIRSGTYGLDKWRIEFLVDAASPVGAPVVVQAICVGY